MYTTTCYELTTCSLLDGIMAGTTNSVCGTIPTPCNPMAYNHLITQKSHDLMYTNLPILIGDRILYSHLCWMTRMEMVQW